VIAPVFYIIAGYVISRICENVNKKFTLILGLVFSAIAYLLQGPSSILHLPNSLFILINSQVFVGFVIPFIVVPNLPEMMESVKQEFPAEMETEVNDKASSVFTQFYGIG
jgi:Ca2+/H+ antiporter